MVFIHLGVLLVLDRRVLIEAWEFGCFVRRLNFSWALKVGGGFSDTAQGGLPIGSAWWGPSSFCTWSPRARGVGAPHRRPGCPQSSPDAFSWRKASNASLLPSPGLHQRVGRGHHPWVGGSLGSATTTSLQNLRLWPLPTEVRWGYRFVAGWCLAGWSDYVFMWSL